MNPLFRPIPLLAGALLCSLSLQGIEMKTPLVQLTPEGKILFAADERGDRIPDFSNAGYMGGGVALPLVPARVRVAPTGRDDTARIQQALDFVGALPPDKVTGLRGAVLLEPGTFRISGSLLLRHSGVVLRGSGDTPNGTLLLATGDDRRPLIRVRGASGQVSNADKRRIMDSRVHVGANILTLSDTTGLNPGDEVLISRPGTEQWIASVGMNLSPGPTPYQWRPGMVDTQWSRTIVAVAGNRVQLDAQLTTAIEAQGGTVAVQQSTGQLTQVGVERLACVSEFDKSNPLDEEHSWTAIELDFVRDAWVRNFRGMGFAGSLVHLGGDTRRITVSDCVSIAPVSEVAGYRRHTYHAAGQQHLFVRCTADQGRNDFVAGYGAAGPIVFLECRAQRSTGASGSIGSWASGLLFDNVIVDGGTLGFDNLEIADQGTGWNAANSVLWQCSASRVVNRRPPGAHNWAIGVWGQLLGDGTWHTSNGFVEPVSLYRAQLSARLGKAGLDALAAPASWAEPVPQPPTLEASVKVVAATQPGADSLLPPAIVAKPLSLRNGWLLVGDRLLRGAQLETAWWRGQMNPARSATVDVSLTRFAPNRYGRGLTDELPQLADTMAASSFSVLRHHYGLWYDRRRDDHEMIRRHDSEVWPPFYELPWARSGKGTTWNGLSRYDLTRYNPWYFRRLREFATLAGERGLVLVNEMYFQHNIIEAGAHWVDFPWRPANAVQDTGFQEPPPFAGGKRIFMAEAFYDTTHPVRRPLHEAYIRQCLSNLEGRPNVIHTLGEEYTGPLEFARFWADVVATWKQEHKSRSLICLSTTKDVQDALLADPLRAPLFDIIEIKYWWKAPGGLFAPEGGKSLAPRQFEREWKGGRPSAATIAEMVWDYRSRFPGKAVTNIFGEADGWATVSAGGSIPRLPQTTDEQLLAALPAMSPRGPITVGSSKGWLLAEPGQQAFVYLPAGGSGPLALPGITGSCEVREIDLKTGLLLPERTRLSKPSIETRPGHPSAFWIVVSK
jgi:hypothetical protein